MTNLDIELGIDYPLQNLELMLHSGALPFVSALRVLVCLLLASRSSRREAAFPSFFSKCKSERRP
jgi:hypothetical protein